MNSLDMGTNVCTERRANPEDNKSRKKAQYQRALESKDADRRLTREQHLEALRPFADEAVSTLIRSASYGAPPSSVHPQPIAAWILCRANCYRDTYQLDRLDNSSFPKSLSSYPRPLLDLLAALAEEGLAFNPWHHSHAGVFEPAPPERRSEIEMESFVVYLRFLKFDSKAALENHLDAYERDHPSDVVFPAAIRHQLVSSPADRALFVPYAGISAAVEAQERASADTQASTSSRRANFTLNLTPEVFEITSFRTPIACTEEFRTNESLGNMECLLVSLLCGRGLNSATGGYFPRVALTALQRRLADGVVASLGSENRHTLSEERQDNIKQAFEGELAVWEELLCEQLPDVAGNINCLHAAHSTSCFNGMFQLKDITKESRAGQAAYWSSEAGPAPNYSRRLLNIIMRIPPGLDARTTDEISQRFVRVGDVWAFDHQKSRYGAAVAFTSRLHHKLKVPVALVEGAEVRPVRPG